MDEHVQVGVISGSSFMPGIGGIAGGGDPNGPPPVPHYVPGVWSCPKCTLKLIAKQISPTNMGPDDKPQRCPNDCGPMWHVTYEQELRDTQHCVKALEEEILSLHDRLADAMNAKELAEVQRKAVTDAADADLAGVLEFVAQSAAQLKESSDLLCTAEAHCRSVGELNNELSKKVGALVTCITAMFTTAAAYDPAILNLVEMIIAQRKENKR